MAKKFTRGRGMVSPIVVGSVQVLCLDGICKSVLEEIVLENCGLDEESEFLLSAVEHCANNAESRQELSGFSRCAWRMVESGGSGIIPVTRHWSPPSLVSFFSGW